MKHKSLVILLAALGSAGCAGLLHETASAPATVASEPTAVASPATGSEGELVCTTEKPTGSNIPKRICRTQAVIDEEQAQAEEFVKRLNAPRPTPR